MVETTDIVIAVLMFVGFILFALAMWGVALRFGPRRGYWNQPAAALMRPGRKLMWSMYAIALVHVLLGTVLAFAAPSGGVAVFLVLLVMGIFYVLCAHSFSLATSVVERRRRGAGRPPISDH